MFIKGFGNRGGTARHLICANFFQRQFIFIGFGENYYVKSKCSIGFFQKAEGGSS